MCVLRVPILCIDCQDNEPKSINYSCRSRIRLDRSHRLSGIYLFLQPTRFQRDCPSHLMIFFASFSFLRVCQTLTLLPFAVLTSRSIATTLHGRIYVASNFPNILFARCGRHALSQSERRFSPSAQAGSTPNLKGHTPSTLAADAVTPGGGR